MIEVKMSFDLLLTVRTYLNKRRTELGISETGVLKPKILTQEKDGLIIYTWNDVISSKTEPPNHPVTHVGFYNPASQKNQVIWTYDCKVNIVSCSINPEKTLLAFTTLSRHKTEGRSGKDLYESFLVELKTSKARVFSLNLQKSSFLKVQFLYPVEKKPKEAFLLVFIHKESVALYKISLAQMGERGICMCEQPKTEQIVRKFVWCQWDTQHQRLHYICNNHDENNVTFQKFCTIQFYQNAKYDNMLQMPLNFPFPLIRSSSRSHYTDQPLCPGIPDTAVNVCVLILNNGTFCVCYQHYKTKTNHSAPRRDHTTSHDEDGISYYICMTHHAKTICGSVSGLPHNKRLSFHWMGDYLMVLLPGYFVHLLNVSSEYEPCHHIMLHNENALMKGKISSKAQSFTSDEEDREHKQMSIHFQDSDKQTAHTPEDPATEDRFFVISDSACNIETLTPCTDFCKYISAVTGYDSHSGCVWQMAVNLDFMLQCFQTAKWTTRHAILHYLLLRTKDIFTLKKIFADICEDPTSPEISTAISEFFITTTYRDMKRQVGREILQLFPFTSVETFRGQFVMNSGRDLQARLSFKSLGSIIISTKTATERNLKKDEDIWDVLRRHLQTKQVDTPKRFSQERVTKEFLQQLKDNQKTSSWEFVKKEESFLGHFSEITVSNRNDISPGTDRHTGTLTHTDTVLGALPVFLRGSAGENTASLKLLTSVTKGILTAHLLQHLKKDSKVKAENVANEYFRCLLVNSRQLCHILCSIKESTNAESIPDLSSPGSDEEYELFQLFERFHLTANEKAFPLPPGFQTYFTMLGFRCLQFNLFLQYVDHGVLQLTGAFMSQLLTDVPDDGIKGENVKLKYELISHLSKDAAEECMKTWNHPLCSRYFAQQQTAEILLGSKTDVRLGMTSEATNMSALFQPLETFIKYLETKTKESQSRRGSPGTIPPSADVDAVLLEEVGLFHSRQSAEYESSFL